MLIFSSEFFKAHIHRSFQQLHSQTSGSLRMFIKLNQIAFPSATNANYNNPLRIIQCEGNKEAPFAALCLSGEFMDHMLN